MVCHCKGCIVLLYVSYFCRLWDFDRDENYLLELSNVGQIPETAHVTFIDYNKVKGERELLHEKYNVICLDTGILSVATSSGHIVMWQFAPYKSKGLGPRVEPSEYWDVVSVTSPITGLITQMRVCLSVR